jgi:hypothetical protein
VSPIEVSGASCTTISRYARPATGGAYPRTLYLAVSRAAGSPQLQAGLEGGARAAVRRRRSAVVACRGHSAASAPIAGVEGAFRTRVLPRVARAARPVNRPAGIGPCRRAESTLVDAQRDSRSGIVRAASDGVAPAHRALELTAVVPALRGSEIKRWGEIATAPVALGDTISRQSRRVPAAGNNWPSLLRGRPTLLALCWKAGALEAARGGRSLLVPRGVSGSGYRDACKRRTRSARERRGARRGQAAAAEHRRRAGRTLTPST